MAVSDRELAYFGGWSRRVVAGSETLWGDPRVRNLEIVPSSASSVILPPLSEWTQRGVPYWLFNTGAASCTVKLPEDGNPTLTTINANSVGRFVYGASWSGQAIGVPHFGVTQPGLVFGVNVTENVANLNVLQRVVEQGYTGAQPVFCWVRINSGVAIGSTSQSAPALTTGTTFGGVSWAASSLVVVEMFADSIVGGWGGNAGRGGVPGTGASTGFAGQAGGNAMRLEIPTRLAINGLVFGGGGGGGGGGSAASSVTTIGGGGGGGRGCNMSSAGGLMGSQPGGASPGGGVGTGGGAFTFGGGGLGSGGGGNGGQGGAAATSGSAGGNATAGATGGAGGAAGKAVSYAPSAGAPSILYGGSNILGAIVAE